MAHPKSKTSKQRRDTRRAHDAIQGPTLYTCPNCGSLVARHAVCPDCGFYRGKQLVDHSESK